MRDTFTAPLWLKIFYSLAVTGIVLMLVAGVTGWDPLHLLGDPL